MLSPILSGVLGRITRLQESTMNARWRNVAIALGNVAAGTAVDIYCAKKLSAAERPVRPVHDYSDRSGIPASMVR